MPTNDLLSYDTDEEDFVTDVVIVGIVAANAAAAHYTMNNDRIPKHVSALSGESFVRECLDGHPDTMYDLFRMYKWEFLELCDHLVVVGGLKDSRGVIVVEQVMMFLFIVGHNTRNRVVQNRFQHSGETISRYFNKVLKACCRLGRILIRPPNWDIIPWQIQNDSRFFPYFKRCVGAIDGTHIHTIVPPGLQQAYRGYKKIVTQNVMAVCDFDLQFTYVLSGWEGTANDSRILSETLANPTMEFPMPPGEKYYLADSGYQNQKGFIVPYRTGRHHHQEFRAGDPQGLEEWFNFRLSSLRSVIERCFGILKKRFPILREMPWGLRLKTQKYQVIACCALHNFVVRYKRNDRILSEVTGGDPDWTPPEEPAPLTQAAAQQPDLTPATLQRWRHIRDRIAHRIFSDAVGE